MGSRGDLKILIADIERIKGRAEVEFFDLGDFKNRRIHADDVLSWPRTICAGYLWYPNKQPLFVAEWDDGGREQFLYTLWEQFECADIVVGHNMRGFDRKKLNTEWRDIGLPPPSPVKVIDTLAVARSEFGDESRTLDAMNRRMGIDAKVDKYDHNVAMAAVNGSKVNQKRIRRYCCGDVRASREHYEFVLPWIKGHPHVMPSSKTEDCVCPRCKSKDTHYIGEWSPGVYIYALYRCNKCGGPFKTEYLRRGPSIKAL